MRIGNSGWFNRGGPFGGYRNGLFGGYTTGQRRAPQGVNTLEDLLSGHYKNSYGVEGMCVTGRSDWKRIIDVSDEMKQHVLEDIKTAYYKYNGMSGDNEAEWDAYYRTLNNYYKTLPVEDRLPACWTFNQLHLELSGKVTSAIKAEMPGWTAGQPVPTDLLDRIFSGISAGGKLDRSV